MTAYGWIQVRARLGLAKLIYRVLNAMALRGDWNTYLDTAGVRIEIPWGE